MSTNNNKHSVKEGEIDEVLIRSELFYVKHLNKIIIAVVIVVLIVLGFFAYKYFVANPRQQKASEAIFMAENSFMNNQDSLTINGNGPGELGTKAIEKEYAGTRAANLAYAYTGISLYDMGKYQQALEQLKKFKSSEKFVAPSIVRLIGDCYVQLGKLDDAVKSYKEAAEMSQNPAITPSCLLKEGHVLEKQGHYDEALKCYNEIKNKYYTTPESQLVEADIIRATAAKNKK